MFISEKTPTEGFYMTLHCTGCQIMCYVTWYVDLVQKGKFYRNSEDKFFGPF